MTTSHSEMHLKKQLMMKRGVVTYTPLLCNDFDTNADAETQCSLTHIRTPASLLV